MLLSHVTEVRRHMAKTHTVFLLGDYLYIPYVGTTLGFVLQKVNKVQ
jgi:hypothetical protein